MPTPRTSPADRLLKHDWRRGPTINYTEESTSYVCVRCGSTTQAPLKKSVLEYDADYWYPLLYQLDRHKEITDFDSFCVIKPEIRKR